MEFGKQDSIQIFSRFVPRTTFNKYTSEYKIKNYYYNVVCIEKSKGFQLLVGLPICAICAIQTQYKLYKMETKWAQLNFTAR